MSYRTRSHELFKVAQKSLVGGVNSPVRAFKSVGGTPVFMKSGKGALVTCEDEKEYIDYVCLMDCLFWDMLILMLLKVFRK